MNIHFGVGITLVILGFINETGEISILTKFTKSENDRNVGFSIAWSIYEIK